MEKQVKHFAAVTAVQILRGASFDWPCRQAVGTWGVPHGWTALALNEQHQDGWAVLVQDYPGYNVMLYCACSGFVILITCSNFSERIDLLMGPVSEFLRLPLELYFQS